MPYDEEDDRPTVAGSKSNPWRTPGLESVDFQKRKYADLEEDGKTEIRQKEPQMDVAGWVYCRKGLRKGAVHLFKKPRTEFGRSSECDLEIEDQYAGSRHGAILFEDGVWKVFDFASKNGTNLNGAGVGKSAPNPSTLKDGDVLEIGDTEYVFKCIGVDAAPSA